MTRPAIKRAELFDSAVNANANLFTALRPGGGYPSTAYRVTIGIKTTDSIVNVQISDGSTTAGLDLNDGTALTAGRLYTFTFGASATYTYTMQCETACTVGYLLVEEIQSGAL